MLSFSVKNSHPPWAPGPSNLDSIFLFSLAILKRTSFPYSLWSGINLPLLLKIAVSLIVKLIPVVTLTILGSNSLINLLGICKKSIFSWVVTSFNDLFTGEIFLIWTVSNSVNSFKILSPLNDFDKFVAKANKPFLDKSLVEP